jgi:hypothetical protein
MKGWLVVREVSSANTVARHWVQFKHRYCVLGDNVLSLRTSDISSTTTSLVGEYSLRYDQYFVILAVFNSTTKILMSIPLFHVYVFCEQ